MLILISDAFDVSLAGKLEQFGEVTDDKTRLPEADIVLIRSKTKATREYIESAPNLKLIIRGGVGTDNIDKACAKERGILVRNTPTASSIAVAELTFAMMLAVPNHIVAAHNGMVAGKWLKKEIKRTELFGKTLCLFGIGHIATEVARRARGFGMSVTAFDPHVAESQWAEMRPTPAAAVTDADYISLHMPLTPETEGMIGADLLSQMKTGVVVVNTCRGRVVDAAAMVKALEDGKVAAYATDVWQKDPPPEDDPILKAPNVLMIPHLGASSKENLLRVGAEAVSIVEEFGNKG
ncbi:MAG: hydroxyacid dehydrogenase [Pseudomonadota bacterium]